MNLSEHNIEITSEFDIIDLGVCNETVYDLEIVDTHNFFGNDILIHNSVWADQEAANILKAALDSYDERIVSWVSGRTVNISKMSRQEKDDFFKDLDRRMDEDPTDPKLKFPSEFPFTGRIIFISNLPMSKLDSAVLNRSAKIDMTLTQEQIFMRMESILEHMGDKSVPMEVKREILEFLRQATKNDVVNVASMRTYVAAEDLYRSGLPDWKDLLAYV